MEQYVGSCGCLTCLPGEQKTERCSVGRRQVGGGSVMDGWGSLLLGDLGYIQDDPILTSIDSPSNYCYRAGALIRCDRIT